MLTEWQKNVKATEEWLKQFPWLMNNLKDSVPILNLKKKKKHTKLKKDKSQNQIICKLPLLYLYKGNGS